MTTTTRSKPTLSTAADDLLHERYSSFGPHPRESPMVTAPIPDEELLVFAYLWREDGTRWGRFLFVAGPDMGKPEFVSFVDDTAHTGDDLRDFELSGLRWRQPEPLRTAELSYADDDLSSSTCTSRRSTPPSAGTTTRKAARTGSPTSGTSSPAAPGSG